MAAPAIFTEQQGFDGPVLTFYQSRNKLSTEGYKKNFSNRFVGFFKEVLLPYGYPESVSKDYSTYQIWDTLQAFCSTIIGSFKTRAVLTSVGVGNSEANAISAATTWILKDGTGMVGRILFAWWKGSGLDSDCKKWRYFADILNDAAMLMELCLCYYSSWSMEVLCLSATMYSIVGIAGGATRASITHHQAIRDNMAEVSAKDGSQETIVNLIGSLGSIFLLNIISSTSMEWVLVLVLMILHLYTNYMAVRGLVFDTLNEERMALTIRRYFTTGTVGSPSTVNAQESLLIGCGLNIKDICGFKIVMGQSTKKFMEYCSIDKALLLQKTYENDSYILFVSPKEKKIYVGLESSESVSERPLILLSAYFHAVCLGIASSILNSEKLTIYRNRQLHLKTPITRLKSFIDNFIRLEETSADHILRLLSSWVRREENMYFTALTTSDWNVDSHNLNVGEYRMNWKKGDKNN
ncbi:unnamed protein product [Ceutorhynchus assimilis]|uniref:RUS family member 1 n=1 Tax=Ceutorhynchus assimilis TaxID=467358 RepID=A0A9N9ME97_9CUCU|nr:unnamed protein product [Ceutorhynchus assimilis]